MENTKYSQDLELCASSMTGQLRSIPWLQVYEKRKTHRTSFPQLPCR